MAEFDGEAFSGLAQEREIGIHADLQASHISLRHFRAHAHGRKVGNSDDGRRGLAGVQRLPLLDRIGDDGAGHGGVDFGVAEIDLVAGERCLLLADLRFCGVDIGFGGAEIGNGLVEHRLRRRVSGNETALTGDIGLLEGELRLLRLKLGL